MIQEPDSTSTRPYLIRALYEWCTDNGLTPYVAVAVDDSVIVPREFVRNGEIVLNISFDATSALQLGNEFIEFKARFSGVPRDIVVPVQRVIAVYARENGQGMAFPMGGTPGSSLGSSDKKLGRDARKAPFLSQVVGSQGSDRVADAGFQAKNGAKAKSEDTPAEFSEEPDPPRSPSGGRPALKRVK